MTATPPATTRRPIADRHLFGPGPCNPYPEATLALAAPLLGHLDPDFLAIMDETCDLLRHVWGTDNRRTLPAVGHRVGRDGGRLRQHRLPRRRRRRGGQRALRRAHGRRRGPPRRRGRPRRPRVGHTRRRRAGRRRPPRRRRSSPPSTPRPPPASAPTSPPSARSRATRCCSSTRSPASAASSCAPTTGASTSATPAPRSASASPPASLPSPSATAPSSAASTKPSSWYLDLGLLGGYVGEASGAGKRTYHHTAPTAMVASLHAGLQRIADEGLEKVWDRHAEAGRLLQDGLEEMGLTLFAAEGSRLPELTTVRVPDGRRLRRRPRLPARAPRPRDRRRRGRVRLDRLAHRPDGPQRAPRPRRPRPRRPQGRPGPRRLTRPPRSRARSVRITSTRRASSVAGRGAWRWSRHRRRAR